MKSYKYILVLALSSCSGDLSNYNKRRYDNEIYKKSFVKKTNNQYSKFSEISENYGDFVPYDACTGGYFKIGTSYKVFGKTYYPKEYNRYVETGMASWYGDDFHDKKTANGDVFDMNSMTAAHKTLPLPSIVKVTNTENGKSVILRVNDRGPFVDDRIIDLSKRASQTLEFKGKGLVKVKVELLKKETERYMEKCGIVKK